MASDACLMGAKSRNKQPPISQYKPLDVLEPKSAISWQLPIPTTDEPSKLVNNIKDVNKNKCKKTRRGLGRKRSNKNKSRKIKVSILGNNANGLASKLDSLENNIREFQPTIQETKLCKKGLVNIQNYQIYEHTRTDSGGGGLMTAVHGNCISVVVSSDESSQLEILVVQVRVGEYNIRVINAYGPQEDSKSDEKTEFWQSIESEIIFAKEEECLVLLQIDANVKVGCQVIKNDLHSTSENGEILLNLVNRQNLVIVKSLPICKGVITRDRVTIAGREQSVIDYVIACDALGEHLEKLMTAEITHLPDIKGVN